MQMFSRVPTLEQIGVKENVLGAHRKRRQVGGETVALEQLLLRVKIEEEEFNKTGLCCRYQPLQNRTDLLASPLLSMSAAIAHGTLSVRL